MPSKYTKVQKRVTKKKGAAKANALHENSRDALRLRKASARDDKVARLSAVREKANEKFLLRITFLRDAIPASQTLIAEDDMHDLVKRYLARDDDVLEELKQERRPGRPASTRQTILEQLKEVEESEYISGFWMPDLRDEENVSKLSRWSGEWSALGPLGFVRLKKSGGVESSGFPPRGGV